MSSPEHLRSAILARLAGVIDPETGVDIVRMRLIEDLRVDEKCCVSYTFRPSSALCPLAVPLAYAIHQAVARVPGVTEQHMRVRGYVQAEELTSLMEEVDRPGSADAERPRA